ncbi:MAG: murein transglycosylase A [bacterium]
MTGHELIQKLTVWRFLAIVMSLSTVFLLFTVLIIVAPFERALPKPTTELPQYHLEKIRFSQLPNWRQGTQAEALPAFLRSCEKIMRRAPEDPALSLPLAPQKLVPLVGTNARWQEICLTLSYSLPLNNQQARQFFEDKFDAYKIWMPQSSENGAYEMTDSGLFTGYFEPTYPAAAVKTDQFSVPVLTPPDDLVTVDLGRFREELKGKSIVGRIKENDFIPYADHQEIIEQGLNSDILAWMNPNDLLFLQIQGSGRLRLPNEIIRVGYAGKNGHNYTAIGRDLINRGEIAREDMSMQAIYQWLQNATPDQAKQLRYLNKSYVFFQRLDNLPDPSLGPLGADGTQLTPGRSLAVDRRFHALGTPLWLILSQSPQHQSALWPPRLVIAQDTGGAIKGAIRGDVFIGSGPEAGEIAGKMKEGGVLYTLLPRQGNDHAAAIE